MSWRNRPKNKKDWSADTKYIIFLDENGDSSINGIIKKLKKGKKVNREDTIFTVSGCIIKKEDFQQIKENILDLKYKYWNNGKFSYSENESKRVCFHSSEIRNRKGPFNSNIIDNDSFMIDLSTYMGELNIGIISASLNKLELCQKYNSPVNPYELCMKFILERIVKYFLKKDENITVILESRGKKEDKELLNYLKELIDKGTKYVNRDDFNKIEGVYFNQKWCKDSQNQRSYIGLEIADLISYPIHKYCRNGIKDRAFSAIESKFILGEEYEGRGLKKFP